jgi:hypothetical protein
LVSTPSSIPSIPTLRSILALPTPNPVAILVPWVSIYFLVLLPMHYLFLATTPI